MSSPVLAAWRAKLIMARVGLDRAWKRSAYSASTSGVSCSGSMLIEYMKMSSPTRSPRMCATFASRAVSSGQESVQLVKMKLMTTTLPSMRSSKKWTVFPSWVTSGTLGKYSAPQRFECFEAAPADPPARSTEIPIRSNSQTFSIGSTRLPSVPVKGSVLRRLRRQIDRPSGTSVARRTVRTRPRPTTASASA